MRDHWRAPRTQWDAIIRVNTDGRSGMMKNYLCNWDILWYVCVCLSSSLFVMCFAQYTHKIYKRSFFLITVQKQKLLAFLRFHKCIIVTAPLRLLRLWPDGRAFKRKLYMVYPWSQRCQADYTNLDYLGCGRVDGNLTLIFSAWLVVFIVSIHSYKHSYHTVSCSTTCIFAHLDASMCILFTASFILHSRNQPASCSTWLLPSAASM